MSDQDNAGVSSALERLEQLQAQIETLNRVLMALVGSAAIRRRRLSTAAELARFRRQARRHTQYGPS